MRCADLDSGTLTSQRYLLVVRMSHPIPTVTDVPPSLSLSLSLTMTPQPPTNWSIQQAAVRLVALYRCRLPFQPPQPYFSSLPSLHLPVFRHVASSSSSSSPTRARESVSVTQSNRHTRKVSNVGSARQESLSTSKFGHSPRKMRCIVRGDFFVSIEISFGDRDRREVTDDAGS